MHQNPHRPSVANIQSQLGFLCADDGDDDGDDDDDDSDDDDGHDNDSDDSVGFGGDVKKFGKVWFGTMG